MPIDPEYPWTFHRNEVDLLEEDIDDIYDLYSPLLIAGQKEKAYPVTMEENLIQEQMETEERSEAEFALRVNPSMFGADSTLETEDPLSFLKDRSLTSEFVRESFRPPFYEHVFVWANRVFDLAKDLYEHSYPKSEQAFRVYLNAKMIPIKLSVGLIEESVEDAFADEVAEKEYVLALIYLDRILQSLAALEPLMIGDDATLMKKGAEIKQFIKELLARLRRRKQHHKNGSV